MPRGHDLSFRMGGVDYGFDLYWEGKDPPLTVVNQETAEATAAFLKRDLPRIWHDWSGGAFHSITPQNAGPLIYNNLGQFGTAPPVYAYTKKMRMRDPAVATPAGLVGPANIYTSAAMAATYFLTSVPKVAFNYNGSVYVILANGDVLKAVNGLGNVYKVANLTDTGGLRVWSEAGSGSKTAATTTFGSGFDPIKVVQYKGAYYVCQRDPSKPLIMFDGADAAGVASDGFWYMSSATGGIGDTAYWVHNNQGFDFFVCKSTKGSIKYTNTSPLQAASFSADYPIGDPSGSGAVYAITNVVSTGRTILVAKEDGVYTFDELGHAPNLTPHLKNAVYSGNGAVGMVFGNYAYFEYFEGTYRINLKAKEVQDVGGWVSPGLGLPNRTPINGPIIAMSQDRDWLAAVVQSNGTSWLGYGRERTDSDPPVGPMIWNFSEYDHDGTISLLHRGTVASTVNAPLMWMGGTNAAGQAFLVYQFLPRASTALADVAAGAPTQFATECELYLPIDPVGDANALKHVLFSSLQATNLSMPTASFDHQVRFTADGAWTSLGICTDPDAWIGIPPDTLTGGYQVEQRLLGYGPVGTPPALYALRTRFAVISDAVGVRKYRLKLGRGTDLRGQGTDHTSLARQWAALDALTRGGKILGHDRILGDRLICRIEQVHQATPVAWSRDGSDVTFACDIEVTVYAQGRSAIRYDDGQIATFDTGSLVAGA